MSFAVRDAALRTQQCLLHCYLGSEGGPKTFGPPWQTLAVEGSEDHAHPLEAD